MLVLTDPTEAEFQAAIVELARWSGWLVWHQVPAQIRPGRWASAGIGNIGFPDLVLAHRLHGSLFLEVKTVRGRVSIEQQQWIDTLTAAGLEARIIRPVDWEWLAGRLRGDLP